MDYAKDTPYGTYEEIMEAVKTKESAIILSSTEVWSVVREFPGTENLKRLSFLGILAGAVVLLGFALYTAAYWLIILIPGLFYLRKIGSLLQLQAVGALVFGVVLVFFNWFLPLAAIMLAFAAFYGGYHLWIEKVKATLMGYLEKDEQLFERLWVGHVVAIRKNPSTYYAYDIEKPI